MSSLREAMIRVDADQGSGIGLEDGGREERIARTWGPDAVGRALVEVDDRDDSEKREAERQAREDEFASWAMEIIVRARQRIGRTKWSSAEGVAKRRIVEALRCLPSED